MNEQQKFLEDLKGNEVERFDILNAPLIPEEGKPEGATEGDEGEDNKGDDNFEAIEGITPRNRQERRKLERLSADRESAIFLQGKLAARDEKPAVTEEAEYLKSIERIYGTETPEAQLATDLLKKAVLGARDDAKAQALAEMRAETQAAQSQLAEADGELDGFIEEIEDTYGVRLNENQERSYFQLLEKMSPKDGQGNVIEYADPHAVWEVFQERTKARGATTTDRSKQLSDRSMTQSGSSKDSTLKDDASTRFLREQGII